MVDGKVKLSLITVTYNDETVMAQFLDSIEKLQTQSPLKSELIIVDNASSDDTVKLVKESACRVTVIESPSNLGFSKANNLGINQSSGDYLLFINPDTMFESDIFDSLISFLDYQTDVGVLTCNVLLPDGSPDLNTRRNFPTPWTAFCHFSKLSQIFKNNKLFAGYYILSQVHEVSDIPACGGAFMLTHLEVVNKIKGWDEDFFLYGEDLDFCYRVHENGYRVVFYPEISIIHYGGVSTGIKKSGRVKSRASKEQRLKMAKYSIEAMDLFYKKHYQDKYPSIINKLVQLGMLMLFTMRRIYYQVL